MQAKISKNFILSDEVHNEYDVRLINLKTGETYSPFQSFFFTDEKTRERVLTLARDFVMLKIRNKELNGEEKDLVMKFLEIKEEDTHK